MTQIYVYHKILPYSKDENTVSIAVFVLQMLLLKLSNKKVVYLDDYNIDDKNTVVITFDDGYSNVKKYAFPILKLFGFPFEIFVCKNFINLAENGNKEFLTIKDLKFLVKNGARLQYHTKSHAKLTDIQDKDLLEKEIHCPNELKQLDTDGFQYLAYPFWVFNDRVISIVKKYYKGARSGNGYSNNTNYSLDAIKVMNNTKIGN